MRSASCGVLEDLDLQMPASQVNSSVVHSEPMQNFQTCFHKVRCIDKLEPGGPGVRSRVWEKQSRFENFRG